MLMNAIERLAASIATTAADYRKDELGPFTADHVMTWVGQFDEEDRLPVLSELDYVLKKTYFSEANVLKFLQTLATEPKLVGPDPATFWKSIGVLDIQQGGNSQADMLERFETVLKKRFGLTIADCEASSRNFLYLDDAIFTGNRVRRDLEPWIEGAAPPKATFHVIVNALHAGSYYAAQQLDKASRKAGKDITITWWRARTIENRKFYRNQSEVLWPSEIPGNGEDEVAQYVKVLSDAGYPPEKRAQGGTPKDGVFSGEERPSGIGERFPQGWRKDPFDLSESEGERSSVRILPSQSRWVRRYGCHIPKLSEQLPPCAMGGRSVVPVV